MKAIYEARINEKTGVRVAKIIIGEIEANLGEGIKGYSHPGDMASMIAEGSEVEYSFNNPPCEVKIETPDKTTTIEIEGFEKSVRKTKSRLLKMVEGLTLS